MNIIIVLQKFCILHMTIFVHQTLFRFVINHLYLLFNIHITALKYSIFLKKLFLFANKLNIAQCSSASLQSLLVLSITN